MSREHVMTHHTIEHNIEYEKLSNIAKFDKLGKPIKLAELAL